MAGGNLSVGPWGSQEPGNHWTYEPQGLISYILITHDDVIYSIRFTSQDYAGNVDYSNTFGSTTGSKSDEVAIDINNEQLNYISGTVDVKRGYVSITSLTFSTGNKTFGPFGTPRGKTFSLRVKDESFIGFHGRAGEWLDAIGVYLKPVPEQRFGTWGSQEPGNEWSYVPKGDIFYIGLTYDDAINSICFKSQEDEGWAETSETFGWTKGSQYGELYLDLRNHERLNNISGTVDTKSGYVVITSLTFSSNKNGVYGPYGTPRGTTFSARVNNGILSGFYGRAGSWLDAIGVVVKPQT